MENHDNQQQNLPADDSWIDEILTDDNTTSAEESVYPEDIDVDQIIDEILQATQQATASIPDEEPIISAELIEPEAIDISQSVSSIQDADPQPTEIIPDDSVLASAALQSEVEQSIDDILETPAQATEILPDEAAIVAAGLTHPDENEVDRLIQDARSHIQPDADTVTNSSTEATQVVSVPFKDEEYRDAFSDGEDFEEVFHSDPYVEEGPITDENGGALPPDLNQDEEEELPPAPPARKKRPRYKAKDNLFGLSHILATFVWLAIIVFIGVTLANVLWVCASDVLAFGRENQEVSITIEDSDTMEDIAKKLQENGLVRYPNLFSMYAQFTGAREEIGSGTFTLNTMYDYHALVNFMNSDSAEREIVEVVIPEGYNCSQLFALLEEKGVCTVADLETYAAEGELDDYWFLEEVKRGDRYCLEGFLFPDTYEFYIDDEPRRVLEKMLDDFDYRFTDEMRSNLIALNNRLTEWMEEEGYEQEYIDEHQLSLRELVIVASLIEEETANTLESYTISSVIYNRLYRWGDTPPFLNIDAAIIYALGEHKEELTVSDLQIDSPYNTYTNMGLTPGPITNPGLYSLNAALDPDDTDYFYYAMDPEIGAHHFSEDEEAHNEFLASLEEE